MAREPFVCPHCRTWVEGEGRTIRCPSCGKRFNAAEARLDRPRVPTTFETLDYEVPEDGSWGYGRQPAEPARDDTSHERTSGSRQPEATNYGAPTSAPGYDSPAWGEQRADEGQASEPWPTATTDGAPAEGTRQESGERDTPWGWIIGIAVLLLFFVGSRFLSGELFLLAFIALIAVQWFLGRKKGDDQA